jgi:hypothetical protein
MKAEDKTFKKIEEFRLSGGYGMTDGHDESVPFWFFIICPVIAHWKGILIAIAVVAIAIRVYRYF